jgi:hypothetical protein
MNLILMRSDGDATENTPPTRSVSANPHADEN